MRTCILNTTTTTQQQHHNQSINQSVCLIDRQKYTTNKKNIEKLKDTNQQQQQEKFNFNLGHSI